MKKSSKPVLSVALSLASVAGLVAWQWTSVTIAGDRLCPDDVVITPVGGYWVPAAIAAAPTLALLLTMRSEPSRLSTLAKATSIAATLFVIVFWAQLLPLVGCGWSDQDGPKAHREGLATARIAPDEGYDVAMSDDRVTVPVEHPSFVNGADFADGIAYLEPKDRVVVSWYAEGSVPDPLMGVDVVDKSDTAVTLRFASDSDATRFVTWLANDKPMLVAVQHRDGLVPQYTQGVARGKSIDELRGESTPND